MSLSDLPTELLLEITTHLDVAGMNALACTNGDVHNLLNNSLYCRDLTQPQSSSLTWGAENGVEGTIQKAVDAAAQKFNPIPESFHIALQIAAKRGRVPIVKLLLDVHGIDPNFEGGSLKAAPLLLAAQEGQGVIVELLLAIVNINPDVRDGDHKHGYTPLIYACRERHVSIVQQLLARNDVDVNARGRIGLGIGRCTPLIMACQMGHVEIINLLLAKDGIDINLVHGTAPLIAAAGRGLVEVVGSFLARDNNLNPNIIDEDGNYALGCAASRGHIDVMKLLLHRPDVDPNFARGFGRTTPLNLGARFPDVVKLLLEQEGIDVNHQDDFGFTALIKTACCCSVESAKLLLERDDINVNISSGTHGRTALYYAYYERSFRDLLLERDDIDINADRYTPSAIADFKKRRDFLKNC
ncbi:Ankyrin repeat-containing domain protein [Elaphomyces granulatus]